jgi:hypothetical protein
VGKPQGKAPLARLRCRLINNIKMDLGETGWTGSVWLRMGQVEGFVKAVKNFGFHKMLGGS